MALIKTYRDLDVYRNAMELAMTVFELDQPDKWLIKPTGGSND